jgi:hypothetical protein
MDVYEAVTSRRAVRGFKDEPVSKEVLEDLGEQQASALACAMRGAPPWSEFSPCEFRPTDCAGHHLSDCGAGQGCDPQDRTNDPGPYWHVAGH